MAPHRRECDLILGTNGASCEDVVVDRSKSLSQPVSVSASLLSGLVISCCSALLLLYGDWCRPVRVTEGKMSATTSPSSHIDRGHNRPPRHNKWREKGEEDTRALALPAGVAQCARCVLARCARLIRFSAPAVYKQPERSASRRSLLAPSPMVSGRACTGHASQSAQSAGTPRASAAHIRLYNAPST